MLKSLVALKIFLGFMTPSSHTIWDIVVDIPNLLGVATAVLGGDFRMVGSQVVVYQNLLLAIEN